MDKIKVMVNGLPGRMASEVVKHVTQNRDFELLPFSLTGPEVKRECCEIGTTKIELISPKQRMDRLTDLLYRGPFISVDFTQPSAVNPNAEFYCSNEFNFVMGTTGGNRELLEDTVRNSQVCAVIAPNMAKQIVAFQAMMEYAAQTFPKVFKGYKLGIQESHQKGKADTSGTAKAMVECFNRLGILFAPSEIVMVRDPKVQLRMGVPEKYLDGHGWHTYTLESEDGTVLFEFRHNVNGRGIYALGTLDAIRYLHRKVGEGERGKVYSMIDVLKGR